MDAQEAEADYRTARAQLDNGQITLEEYNRVLAELMYRDYNGTWWAVSPQDGSWLKWNGTEWVPGFGQTIRPAPVVPAFVPAHHAVQPVKKPLWHIPSFSREKKRPVEEPATRPGLSLQQQPVPAPEAQPAGARRQSASPAALLAALKEKIPQGWPGIVSLGLGLVAWIRYPYICGIIAIILGGFSLYGTRKSTGTIAAIPMAAIVLALAAMLINSFL